MCIRDRLVPGTPGYLFLFLFHYVNEFGDIVVTISEEPGYSENLIVVITVTRVLAMLNLSNFFKRPQFFLLLDNQTKSFISEKSKYNAELVCT